MKVGAALKDGFGGFGIWNWKGSFGCGCSMKRRGCTLAIGEEVLTSSSVVLDMVAKLV